MSDPIGFGGADNWRTSLIRIDVHEQGSAIQGKYPREDGPYSLVRKLKIAAPLFA
jgi:hypothetical protein